MNTEIPFVGLHAHSTFSVFDGFGFPSEHMDRAHAHGMDALALTDHGNCNGLAYQVLHAKQMKKDGKNFKPIYGVEAYFLPSLKEWEKTKEDHKAGKKKIKESSGFAIEDEEETKKIKSKKRGY